MLVLHHPTGNANTRAAALGLAASGHLSAFHTCIAAFPGDWLDQLAQLPGLGELQRRRFDPALREHTRLWPWREMGRLLASKARLRRLTAHESGLFSVDAVYRSLDRRVASTLHRRGRDGQPPQAVYGYDDGAYASFQAARRLGMACVYDLPTGYWRAARRLLEPELARWPEWGSTMIGFLDSPQKLARKDEELRMADRILVASSFTRRTLDDFPGPLAPIEVVPYGFPPVTGQRHYRDIGSGPVKLLFVGNLSQGKGVADLFAAVEAFGPRFELTVVGRRPVHDNAALNAALARHRWIPGLPHPEVLALMREHDVFVFPSLFDGFGMVISEAMSQGTPVITTERTVGLDLIEHGRNGWICEAANTAALQAALEQVLLRPQAIAECGAAAMESARRRPWPVYGQELAQAVQRALDERQRPA
ncbi:glycosyltransferase family 4 protein [Variovorax sp.]|uniref:glycosyltransferase family 4 protein n=1 Tax=Variovorax sp. TaxID=1871043 RepID=UPI002D2C1803|nr:glycosyltransferase family 4 protein [Variovorax sp.]HYP84710.1 glycosyltransferase family 4 protein [Variovorax sp.]